MIDSIIDFTLLTLLALFGAALIALYVVVTINTGIAGAILFSFIPLMVLAVAQELYLEA